MHAEKKHHKPICMARILPATPKVPVNLNIRNLANTCVSKDLNYSPSHPPFASSTQLDVGQNPMLSLQPTSTGFNPSFVLQQKEPFNINHPHIDPYFETFCSTIFLHLSISIMFNPLVSKKYSYRSLCIHIFPSVPSPRPRPCPLALRNSRAREVAEAAEVQLLRFR